MKKIKKIHFVGIKGVGVAPLAIIAKEAGLSVSGCDINEEFITDVPLKRAGIKPLIGFSKEHIENIDLVITTGAHGGFDNPEVKYAQGLSIPILTQGEAVGKFMEGGILGKKNLFGVSITGSHGKTTTTAMVATIFKEAGLDPSFVIGTGDIPSLGSSGHFGKGRFFVAEADEYATEPKHDKTPKFLWQHPSIAIVTNIELDHPDLYHSVSDIRKAVVRFAGNVSQKGVLILNSDDLESRKLLEECQNTRIITFGKDSSSDYILKKVNISGNQTFFWVEGFGASLGEFALRVVGEHNALNALAAIVASLEVGISLDKIREGLRLFTGTKRRFEYIGRLKTGALLFDDYAHHPTEVKKTLIAFRKAYPKSKIVCIYQPHTYSRTKKLFDDFIYSFSTADTVIMCNIYPSLREKIDSAMSSKSLVDEMTKFHKNALFLPELNDVVEYIEQKKYPQQTVLITMGAGDVYKIGEMLGVKNG